MIVAFLALLAGCSPTRHCDESGVICTVVGDGEIGLGAEGAVATDMLMYWPSDLTIGPDGNPWILDWNNHRIITIRPDADGVNHMVRITGNALVGDGPWTGAASAAFWNHPTNILFNDDGTFLFAAWHNSRVIGVDPVADTLWLEAGDGKRAFDGDGGPAVDASFDLPVGLARGPDGTLYVSDQANQRIRAIDGDGIITTVVGTGEAGFSGDGGPALDAQLQSDRGQNADPSARIAIDGSKLYIADTLNNRIRVVDLDTMTIDTFAGSGNQGDTAEGEDALSAPMKHPRDIAIGPDGSVYYADSEDNCVRRVHDGVVDTVAGQCGTSGFAGDHGQATDALLDDPFGIDVGPDGALSIADTYNQRIRRVAP